MKSNNIKEGYINLIRINALLYFTTIVGLSIIPSKYINFLDIFLRSSISLFLIYRFSPFNKNKFTNTDKQIVFSSALFLFSTTALNNFIREKLSNSPFLNSFI
tara:strand:+ start:4966 stop:5274 length:309 start_codon:yes stop_codon:yes gene_type:complete